MIDRWGRFEKMWVCNNVVKKNKHNSSDVYYITVILTLLDIMVPAN